MNKARIAADFSRAAKHYDDYAQLQQRVMAHLCEQLPEVAVGAQLLDVGSGTGKLAEFLPQAQLTGLDIAEGMCRQAKEVLSPVVGDMEALPFASSLFDGVYSSLAIQWSSTPEAFLSQAYDVTRSGGWLAVATLTQGTLQELSSSYASIGRPAPLLEFSSKETIYNAARSSGWEVTQHDVCVMETQHAELRDLLKHFKGLGAQSKKAQIALRHKGDLAALERAYPFTPAGELCASWHVYTLIARKK